MCGKTLHLYFTESDRTHIDEDNEFVITEDLPDDDNWFTRLSELTITQENIFSYDIFWPHLVGGSRGNLLIYIRLYTTLSDRIERDNIASIISHDLEKGYRLVAEDLAEKYGITVEHKQQDTDELFSTSNVLVRFSIIILIADQMLSVIKNRFFSSISVSRYRPLFFPYPGRYESMLPVIREIEQPSNIVVTPLTISWRLLNPIEDWPKTHCTNTLSEFADLSMIKKQTSSLFRLQKEVITDGLELSQKLDMQLRNEYSVHLPKTTRHVCQTILQRDIRLILTLYLIENAVKQIKPSSIIVGGDNPRDRYLLEVGESVDADLYYIPHSIMNERKPAPHVNKTTQFVAGQADKRVLQSTYKEEHQPNIRPVGRPYLDNRVDTVGKKIEQEEKERIILGTQPFDDWIREIFVIDILDVIEQIRYNGDVIIKIHPSESPKYYENLMQKRECEFEIRIEQGDIASYVHSSTILVTINSNVGIEGILLGASCISYNPFEPFTTQSSFIDAENVPYATTASELRDHIEYVLEQNNVVEKQQEYIREVYEIGGSKERLSEEIQ